MVYANRPLATAAPPTDELAQRLCAFTGGQVHTNFSVVLIVTKLSIRKYEMRLRKVQKRRGKKGIHIYTITHTP